ncbi:hypothetical protein GOV09_02110 [Candidatus Woesearchaeota archaeon]|nr:hypothetical protein [Candidatus Woesearchaeota archaeon]
MEELTEFKKIIKSKEFIAGTGVTIKLLRQKRLKKIWLSSNVPETVKKDILQYASMAETPVASLPVPNDELGVLCKKQFPVSVAALKVEK